MKYLFWRPSASSSALVWMQLRQFSLGNGFTMLHCLRICRKRHFVEYLAPNTVRFILKIKSVLEETKHGLMEWAPLEMPVCELLYGCGSKEYGIPQVTYLLYSFDHISNKCILIDSIINNHKHLKKSNTCWKSMVCVLKRDNTDEFILSPEKCPAGERVLFSIT